VNDNFAGPGIAGKGILNYFDQATRFFISMRAGLLYYTQFLQDASGSGIVGGVAANNAVKFEAAKCELKNAVAGFRSEALIPVGHADPIADAGLV
jgi:hypothetical protein